MSSTSGIQRSRHACRAARHACRPESSAAGRGASLSSTGMTVLAGAESCADLAQGPGADGAREFVEAVQPVLQDHCETSPRPGCPVTPPRLPPLVPAHERAARRAAARGSPPRAKHPRGPGHLIRVHRGHPRQAHQRPQLPGRRRGPRLDLPWTSPALPTQNWTPACSSASCERTQAPALTSGLVRWGIAGLRDLLTVHTARLLAPPTWKEIRWATHRPSTIPFHQQRFSGGRGQTECSPVTR